jgi:protein involved in temperature-dependent protein secretion
MFRQQGTDRADRLATSAVVDLQLLSNMMRAARFFHREGILLAEEVPNLIKRQRAMVAQSLRDSVNLHHRNAGKLFAVHALMGCHMVTALTGLAYRIFLFKQFLGAFQYFHQMKISGDGLDGNNLDF